MQNDFVLGGIAEPSPFAARLAPNLLAWSTP